MLWIRVAGTALIGGVAATVIAALLTPGGFDITRGLGVGVPTAIGMAIAFFWLLSETSLVVPGVSLAEAEARIARHGSLKGFARTDEEGAVRYTAGKGFTELTVRLTGDGDGVRLSGHRQAVNQAKRGASRPV